FFFSSRRRHTRSLRDWSSDVCSSDLGGQMSRVLWFRYISPLSPVVGGCTAPRHCEVELVIVGVQWPLWPVPNTGLGSKLVRLARSEERRVGKEGRCSVSRSGVNQSTD